MLTTAQGLLIVRQRKAEHHLYTTQQRMELPNDGRLRYTGEPYSAVGHFEIS